METPTYKQLFKTIVIRPLVIIFGLIIGVFLTFTFQKYVSPTWSSPFVFFKSVVDENKTMFETNKYFISTYCSICYFLYICTHLLILYPSNYNFIFVTIPLSYIFLLVEIYFMEQTIINIGILIGSAIFSPYIINAIYLLLLAIYDKIENKTKID